jgi:hypothetical protein
MFSLVNAFTISSFAEDGPNVTNTLKFNLLRPYILKMGLHTTLSPTRKQLNPRGI